MAVVLIGCGHVGAVHAAQLRRAGVPIAAVCDSNLDKAQSFSQAYGVEHAVSEIGAALEHAVGGKDAVIVASPSPLHYEHALCALGHGLHVLVELPPCAAVAQAEHLAQTGARANLTVQCAHTSRYLEPYQRISEWLRQGRGGEVRQIRYFRCVIPTRRQWTDDALLHHAAHPLDLLLHWFGSLQPLGCAASPGSGPPGDVSLLACLPNGAPVTIAISYSAKQPLSSLSIICDQHTVLTDGFSFIDSDDDSVHWRGDAETVYHAAIAEQDVEFLGCCETRVGGIPWSETIRMLCNMAAFQSRRGGATGD